MKRTGGQWFAAYEQCVPPPDGGGQLPDGTAPPIGKEGLDQESKEMGGHLTLPLGGDEGSQWILKAPAAARELDAVCAVATLPASDDGSSV